MFTDTRELPDRATLRADVCVVGAGAAGIALALELARGPLRVVLLEGGGGGAERGGRGIYQVTGGRAPRLTVDDSRTWYFGGNTNYWNGHCRPLEEGDFQLRDWVPHSGWPFRRDDLLPYYERAQAVCGLGDFRWYDVEACRPHLRHPPFDIGARTITTKLLQACPVPNLGDLHRRPVEAAPNVRVLLHASARRLQANAGGDRVESVEAMGGDGRRLRVEAGAFVLAVGGIENARLLLLSGRAGARGANRLANDIDLVGRFFMEHWYVDVPFTPSDTHDLTLYDEVQPVGDAMVWGQLATSEELQRRHRVPGLSLWFHPIRAVGPLASAPAGKRAPFGRLLANVRLAIRDPGDAAAHVLRRLGARADGAPRAYFMRVQLEQAPDPENRIRLSSRLDRDGRPEVDLTLRLGDVELRGQLKSLKIAAEALGYDGRRLARRLKLRLDAGRGGFFTHHSGSTRMSDDPARGVVGADCRVHGVGNLFVCGSSVFPTAGTAPPTLTIVALALRLADHLQGNRAQVAID